MAGAASAGSGAGPLRDLRPRSLGVQLVLLLTGIGLAGAMAIAVLLVGIIAPSFDALEDRSVAAQAERARFALEAMAAKLETVVHDHALSDASHHHMSRPASALETDDRLASAVIELRANGIAYIDNDGRILSARWTDARGGDDRAMRARLMSVVRRRDQSQILGARTATAYFARLGTRVAVIGLARVQRSERVDTSPGLVLVAREITAAQLSTLLRTRVQVVSAEVAQGVVRMSSADTIAVPMTGADGKPVARARFVVGRDVKALGHRMLLLSVGGLTLLLLLLLAVLRRTMSRMVLEPLAQIEQHMQHVRASGSLRLLPESARQDEVSSLKRSFNAMLRQLSDLREQIEAQSFALGRSESAVMVMHNVRNALSPVSTILSHGIREPARIDRAALGRALAELATPDLPEARRRKLVAFVLASLEVAEAARAEQVRQLEVGRGAMAHVLEIIGKQQAHAHERPPLAEVDVTEIIAQNATIARYSDTCSIAFSFPAQPAYAVANRVILSQVIGNLFANAGEAIAATGRNSGSIAVTVSRDRDSIVIRVHDDGEGFDPDAVPSLFQRGFSTRVHKNGGLGLHWCANSMVAMDGSLTLVSEGRGRGAVAVLTLRAAQALAVAA